MKHLIALAILSATIVSSPAIAARTCNYSGDTDPNDIPGFDRALSCTWIPGNPGGRHTEPVGGQTSMEYGGWNNSQCIGKGWPQMEGYGWYQNEATSCGTGLGNKQIGCDRIKVRITGNKC